MSWIFLDLIFAGASVRVWGGHAEQPSDSSFTAFTESNYFLFEWLLWVFVLLPTVNYARSKRASSALIPTFSATNKRDIYCILCDPFTFRMYIFVVISRDLPLLAILLFSELLSAFLPVWYLLTLLILGNSSMFLESVYNMSSSFAKNCAVFVVVINCVAFACYLGGEERQYCLTWPCSYCKSFLWLPSSLPFPYSPSLAHTLSTGIPHTPNLSYSYIS